jgi:CHAT domain-containing protein
MLLDAGKIAVAFEWAQRAKARALMDLIDSTRLDTSVELSADQRDELARLKHRDREMSGRWLASRRALDDLRRAPSPDPAKLSNAEKQAVLIGREQKQLDADWLEYSQRLLLQSPRLARLRPARTATVQSLTAVLPSDAALLEYFALGSGPDNRGSAEIALFVVTKPKGAASLSVHRIKGPAGLLERLARGLRAACAGRPGSIEERPHRSLARSLYERILAPASSALSGTKRLVICPDGPLWEIPFQALLRSSGSEKRGRTTWRYLWEEFGISYGYSASGVTASANARKGRTLGGPNRTMLIVANPSMGDSNGGYFVSSNGDGPSDGSVAISTLRAGALGPLPHTRLEARAIAACYPDAVVREASAAQESFVKRTAAEFRILHFATHAVVNDSAPMLTGVILSRPPRNSMEDGVLTVRELFEMKLNADLAVFSACETARGTQKRGEGIIGLTWGAFAAGVPAQVVSQWAVDDAATARLMEGFYRAMKAGTPKESALRSAALATLRNPKHNHPFYWAPFLVMGDWR